MEIVKVIKTEYRLSNDELFDAINRWLEYQYPGGEPRDDVTGYHLEEEDFIIFTSESTEMV